MKNVRLCYKLHYVMRNKCAQVPLRSMAKQIPAAAVRSCNIPISVSAVAASCGQNVHLYKVVL